MNVQTVGQLAALGTALCWAITSLSFEAAGRRVGSLQVNIIRLFLALAVFAAFLTVTRGAPLPIDAGPHVWLWLSLSGLVGFVLGDLFLFQAFVDVGARTAMVVYSLVPPMTAVIGWLVLGEVLLAMQIVAMGITVTGIILVVMHPPAARAAPAARVAPGATAAPAARGAPRPHRVRGVWFAVLGAVGQALGLVLSRYGAPSYDPFAATQVRVIAGLAGFSLVFLITGRWSRVFRAVRDRGAMVHIARGAFFGPFLGVSLGLFAAQRTSTGVAATLIATVPVLLIPVTVVVFHEKVTLREAAGALLAVTGVALLFLW